jgi:outer membrane protein assembly factor BamB
MHMRIVTTALALAFGALHANDWPQWGGNDPGRNMVAAEKNLPESFVPGTKSAEGLGIDPATTKNVRWVARLGSYIYGNPTVAGGRVFVGTDDTLVADDRRFQRSRGGMVQCLDAQTGKELWRLVVPRRPAERLPKDALYGQQHFGTCSSPAVADGRVFLLTNACEIVCLDVDGLADGNDGPFTGEGAYMAGYGKDPVELQPTDADILWVCDLVDLLGVCPHDVASCSPLVDGDFLYCVTSNGVDEKHERCINPEAPSYVCLDTRTGRVLATDAERMGARLWHCLWSPPSLGVVEGRKLVFFGGPDGFCYAFEALTETPEQTIALKKAWWYDCNPPHYRLRDGQPIPYYAGDKRKKDSPNKDDGAYLGPSQIISTPVFHAGRVYVTIGQDPAHGRGRGILHCIDATKTGDITAAGRIWSYEGLERSLSSVAIADGLLYAVDLPGRLHCMNPVDGKVNWIFELNAETWGTPLVADGKVFIGTKKYLHVFAAGAEARELAKMALGSPSYGTPIAANGVLFVTSERYLWAAANEPACAELLMEK